MPSLLLTYLGIGALLLRDPEAIESPFFLLAPDALQLPLVLLATFATVIASQALISGVFSLTLQAVQLGYAPRTRIVNTSPTAKGQIYVPLINWGLMIACVGLVVVFGSSARLAAAFGLSVTGTMFITTILFAVYAHRHWGWSLWLIGPSAGLILIVEGAFLLANVFKIPDGGWFPLVVGVAILTLLTTWKTGRALVAERVVARRAPLGDVRRGSRRRPAGRGRAGARARPCSCTRSRGSRRPAWRSTSGSAAPCTAPSTWCRVLGADVPRVHPLRRVETTDVGAGVQAVDAALRVHGADHGRRRPRHAPEHRAGDDRTTSSGGRRSGRPSVRGWPAGGRSSTP